MFGLSLPKLVVLIAVIAVVIYGFRWVERATALKKKGKDDKISGTADDMVACPRCGTFVAIAKAGSCGRADCPYG